METGRLLFPAIRWDPASGFDGERARIDEALEHGVGGFILFGGPADAVRELTAELRARSHHPLLFGSDLERGAGQQFAGATQLPPLAALGWLDDVALTRRAAEVTALEAAALGIHWIYAPVADVDLEPRNPIVGTRAFGSDPDRVAAHVAAWIDGCHAGGAYACAKHFPGHGRTTTDSHLELPRVEASREALEADLVPFRRAVAAGVDSVMTAHVRYDALDPSGAPATLSPRIVGGVLRGELGFDGVVVTDALIMEGVLEEGAGEAAAAVRALVAGCDALLYPADVPAVARAIASAVGRELPEARVAEAIRRVEALAARARGDAAPRGEPGGADAWALDVARRCVHVVRGRPGAPAGTVQLLVVDDDVGGPYPPPPRDAFPAALRALGGVAHVREVGDVAALRTDGAGGAGEPLLVAVYADIRAWKGSPRVSEAARERVRAALAIRPEATIVLFGHPRLAAELPGDHVLAAWGGDAIMQRAAAARLAEGAG